MIFTICGNWLMWFFGDSYLVCNTTRLLLCNERNQFWIILDHQDSHNRNRLQHQNQKIESQSLQQVHVTIQRPIDKQIIEWNQWFVTWRIRACVRRHRNNQCCWHYCLHSVCWHYWYFASLWICWLFTSATLQTESNPLIQSPNRYETCFLQRNIFLI